MYVLSYIRDEANALINSPRTKEGSFIIRRSESQPGKFVLHIKYAYTVHVLELYNLNLL